MAVTLNALTTGVGGLQTTGDTSGAIQLQSNGTATLTIDTSGNVGIGTASPTQALTVNGRLTFSNLFAAANIDGIYLGSGVGTIVNTATGNNIAFNTGTTERMRIGTAGEIGLSGANYGTSGQFLTSNGPGAAVTWTTAAGGFSNMQVFTSPGTFTTPATTTKIKVTVVGGGGSGGACFGPGIGAGGGGGGAAIYVGPVTASTPYAVTVGAGGAGVAAGTAPANSGNSGGTSSFGALASATGGAGGAAGTTQQTLGGAGGAGTAGTLQFTGGAGGNVRAPSSIGSGAGFGGSSFLAGATIAANSQPGNNYGGGSSGFNTATSGNSTAGAGGVVVVEF